MLRNFKIWQKMFLMTLLLALPLGFITFLYIREANEDVTVAVKGRTGTAYLATLRKTLELVPQHERQMSANNPSAANNILTQIETAFGAIAKTESDYGASLNTVSKFNSLNEKWNEFKSKANGGDAAERRRLNAEVVSQIRGLMALAGDNSNLVLDSELDSYYAVDVMLNKLPEHQEDLSKLWLASQDILSRKSLSVEEKTNLLLLIGKLKGNVAATTNSMNVGINNNASGTLRALSVPTKENEVATKAFAELIEKRIVNTENIDIRIEELNASGTRALNASFQLWDSTNPLIDALLSASISEHRQNQFLALGGALVLMLLVVVLIFLLIRSITRPLAEAVNVAVNLSNGDVSQVIRSKSNDEMGLLLNAMNDMTEYLREMATIAEHISRGDFSVRVRPRGQEDAFGSAFQNMTHYLQEMAEVSDEIAKGNLKVNVQPKSDRDRFGKSFKNMLDNTLGLVQSQDERDRIQDSIMKLLNEVADVSDGDLTVEAEVTPDMTGAIADAFNYMIAQLRQLIQRVKNTTLQVGSSASDIQQTTESLAKGSELQSQQILDTSQALSFMAASILKVSDNADTSAKVAEESLESAKLGTEAVNNNIEAMHRIREQVQETAKRIKRLGERSQEIGEIVQIIDDIADRTSMLALNASIQAAMAGEAGRGFATVAEEVERLAERSTNATKQISTLTEAIQTETNEVVAAMEETTREVVEGSQLANEAGQALQKIQTVSHGLAQLIQSISQSAKQQARGSEALAQAMTGISEITGQVTNSSRQAAHSVRSLVSLADELRGSVVTFKLPENQNGNTGNLNNSFNGLNLN